MSCEVPRVSPHTAHAYPSARTERARDCAFAGDGEISTEANQDPPAGFLAARTCAGVVRASSQTTVRLPALSMPMRGMVCAVVPGSSEILVFAAQPDPPLGRVEKYTSALPFRESCHTA